MAAEIIGLDEWLQSPPGRWVLAWEQAQCDQALADVFGFNALQLGVPSLSGLAANRMPHRWLALNQLAELTELGALAPQDRSGAGLAGRHPIDLVCDAAALPFQADTLDLVVLPHTLELSADPHQALREAARVLRPEGRVLITGLNPLSLWALRQRQAHACERLGWQRMAEAAFYLPQVGEFMGHWRLKDWLRLLDFEVESTRFGVYQPAVRSQRWLQRLDWTNRLGPRWWPILGAAYAIVAVKRVRGTRLLGTAWKPFRPLSAVVPQPVAGRQTVTPAVANATLGPVGANMPKAQSAPPTRT